MCQHNDVPTIYLSTPTVSAYMSCSRYYGIMLISIQSTRHEVFNNLLLL